MEPLSSSPVAGGFGKGRRLVLKGLLALLVVLAAPATFLGVRFGPKRRPGQEKFKHLSPIAVGVLLATWRAVLSPQQRQRYPHGEEGFLKKADNLIGFQEDYVQADFNLAMQVLHWFPISRFQFQSFADLPPKTCLDMLRGMTQSTNAIHRLLEEAPRKLVNFLYYTDPVTWADMGYDGPTVPRNPRGWSP